jgi:tetratricopeptide (TPR) repeat protein
MKNKRPIFALKLQSLIALQGGDEPQYEGPYLKALESAQSILGPESAIDMLLFDLHFLKKDYAAAQNCIRNALKAVGDDAYLYHLQGLSAIRGKDFESAAACLKSAEKIEPELSDLVDLRLQVRASEGDFAGVVREVNRFSKETGVAMPAAIFDDEAYAGFRRSPEYAAWVSSLKN